MKSAFDDSSVPSDLSAMPRDEFALAILHRLEEGGFAQPVLQGGALRDAFMRHATSSRDLDVWVNFGNSSGNRPLHLVTPGFYPALIEKLFPGAEIIDAPAVQHTSSLSASWGRVVFRYEGRVVDLSMTTMQCDIDTLSMVTDAPLNGVAMDKTGAVKAHPLFVAHAQERVYAPLPTVEPSVAEARYQHLRQRIPDLKLDKP